MGNPLTGDEGVLSLLIRSDYVGVFALHNFRGVFHRLQFFLQSGLCRNGRGYLIRNSLSLGAHTWEQSHPK